MAIKSYTDLELNSILEQFTVPKAQYTFQPMTSGLINDTFLVSKSGKPLYVLQRINDNVFENVEGLMINIDRSLKHLKGKQYEKIALVATTSGKNYLPVASKYWRVLTYIANSTTYNITTSTEIAFEAGKIIGKFHSLLSNADLDQYSDTIYKFHSLELRQLQFLSAVARASSKKTTSASDAISFAQEMFKKLEVIPYEQLPQRICHNDTKLNNILFSTETQKALCLIDLDTVMAGYFYYDFGDAIRTIVNTAPEDEQDHSKITFDKNLFEAFVNGLATHKRFLKENEIKALPLGVVLMPFLHGIRALTDYLNNNIYYKVTYENQNLDRCLSLFDFTQKAYKELGYMESVVVENLSYT